MRLFTKIFLCGTLVFSLAFSVSGYFLIRYSMESSMEREIEFALKQYQYDKFTVQARLLSQISATELSEALFAGLAGEIDSPLAFYGADKSLLYSEIGAEKGEMDSLFGDSLSENVHVYQFQSTSQGDFILTGGVLHQKGKQEQLYFITQWDIGDTIRQQDIMIDFFKKCFYIAMAAGMTLFGILAGLLTVPLKKMTKAAERMAKGYYEGRLSLLRRDEIGELAQSFNQMAAAVEENVGQLSNAARQKEDFVANFAHELKTPLTSIIGYADMLYQKELPRNEVQRASWYIWNEGMRLEGLSLKLMDLIVLGRQEFPLQEMPADELLQDVGDGLQPVLREKGIAFQLRAVPAYIRVDYDLFKTLLLNIVDNSIKAGGGRIELSGELRAKEPETGKHGTGEYRISIKDDGCGMPGEELSRITEAFYMVDKARSRKQHGAGLGLALAEKIAWLHGCTLVFESEVNKGTKVTIHMACKLPVPPVAEQTGEDGDE